jgi:2-aminoethylphosphonate transport system ATP-binding protein
VLAPLKTMPGSDFDSGMAAPTLRNRRATSGTSCSHIRFESVNVRYGKNRALIDFDLGLNMGEALALLGPSGSGKTTILRALAGFTPLESGRITIQGEDISRLPPQRRGFGIVVQNYALFPHMSVAENVAFGLRARRASRAAINATVADCLATVGMSDYFRRRPHELSGGQQQRVALARALAVRPDVLLMDEPLSALDAPLRREMLGELINLHRKLPGLTMLLVTHDQAEALALADRIGLLNGGELLALDTPQLLYDRPPNLFAAGFLGQANLLKVDAVAPANGDGKMRIRLGRQTLLASAPDEPGRRSLSYWLCLRPHHLSLRPEPLNGALTGMLDSIVLSSEWKGSHYRVTVEVEGQSLCLEANAALTPPTKGSRVRLFFPSDAAWLLPRQES